MIPPEWQDAVHRGISHTGSFILILSSVISKVTAETFDAAVWPRETEFMGRSTLSQSAAFPIHTYAPTSASGLAGRQMAAPLPKHVAQAAEWLTGTCRSEICASVSRSFQSSWILQKSLQSCKRPLRPQPLKNQLNHVSVPHLLTKRKKKITTVSHTCVELWKKQVAFFIFLPC